MRGGSEAAEGLLLNEGGEGGAELCEAHRVCTEGEEGVS